MIFISTEKKLENLKKIFPKEFPLQKQRNSYNNLPCSLHSSNKTYKYHSICFFSCC